MPKNWCFRIVVLELLRVPWTVRRANQSILKEINPEYPLEGLMLKLRFQYFGHLMQTADSLEKTLMLGKIEGKRRRGQQRMRWLDGITDSMDMNLGKLWEMVRDKRSLVCCSPWGRKELDMTWRHDLATGFCLWNSPGQNTGVGSHSLLQGILPAQESDQGLLHCSRFFTV